MTADIESGSPAKDRYLRRSSKAPEEILRKRHDGCLSRGTTGVIRRWVRGDISE